MKERKRKEEERKRGGREGGRAFYRPRSSGRPVFENPIAGRMADSGAGNNTDAVARGSKSENRERIGAA